MCKQSGHNPHAWFRYSDYTRPGKMIDYVLVDRHFHTSILDTHVFTFIESDHELVISTNRFKIKAKYLQNTGLMKRHADKWSFTGDEGRVKVALAAALPYKPT